MTIWWCPCIESSFNITVIQVYTLSSNAEEAEVEWFYEDLQDLPELTLQKDGLIIIGNCKAKVKSQETPGVTGKFGLGVQNEAGKSLIECCQEKALVRANTLFQQHKRRLCTWTSPDGQYRNLIIFFAAKDGEALCSQQKQDQELTVAQIMNCLLQNSDLKKVEKTTRPFRYDLNQIPNNNTVEVTNRFKGLDLVDRIP